MVRNRGPCGTSLFRMLMNCRQMLSHRMQSDGPRTKSGPHMYFISCHHPRGYVSNILVRPASSWDAPGKVGTPSRQNRGIDPPVAPKPSKRLLRWPSYKLWVFLYLISPSVFVDCRSSSPFSVFLQHLALKSLSVYPLNLHLLLALTVTLAYLFNFLNV